MWLAVALLLSTDPLWTDPLGTGRNGVTKVMRPKGSQIREAFEDLDKAMKVWERERREHLDEQIIEQQRVQQKQRDSAPMPEAALKKYKVIEVGKGGSSRKGRGKVIEMPEREKGDAEIERLAAEAQAHREKCKAD